MEHYILTWSEYGRNDNEVCLYDLDEVIGALRAIQSYRLKKLELKLFVSEE